MGLFRTPPWQVRYGPYYIPATVDENEYGIYVSFALLFVAWLLLLPLQRCAPKPMLRAVAVLAALALGLVIIGAERRRSMGEEESGRNFFVFSLSLSSFALQPSVFSASF